ncbi:uncharacterized protein LOC111713923 [Eurytemora carolleeae]|uniref:uncharacterized protein LOC111713923 n=1 Tax=Eurytemora carolleeae TaxID=1294199 RepID=UPI000C766B0D|nr:uncharacterized protein LOC111713923 [Eurytemora carolleeae]|eukprot:XP_023344682.1 uncharacterized protein LOC111713923 [Eurytemora affinis]
MKIKFVILAHRDLQSNKQFMKIQQEIRDRESERKRRSIQKGSVKIMEEDVFYVDSNRGIATSSGAKDIRGFILKQRKYLELLSQAHFKDFHECWLLREQGERELKLGNSILACMYLDKAVKFSHGDTTLRIIRGRARLNTLNSKGALEDAEWVLDEMKENINSEALLLKAEALYHLGIFEYALLFFNRALQRTRLESKAIKMGIDRTQEVILETLGISYFINLVGMIKVWQFNKLFLIYRMINSL